VSIRIDLKDAHKGWVARQGGEIIKPNDGFYYKTKAACIRQVSGWSPTIGEWIPADVEVVPVLISFGEPVDLCSCGHIKLNGKPTGSRNMSPTCIVHKKEEEEAAQRLGFHG
jgi:hypothetical protein